MTQRNKADKSKPGLTPNCPDELLAISGSYALLLTCRQQRPLAIGRLGTLHLQPGTYVYVGSAFGPGGLRARLAHHLRIAEHFHWHLDYLRQATEPQAVWYSTAAHRQEHLWAKLLTRSRGAQQPLPGFGASDCACLTHLFFFSKEPSFAGFRRRLNQFSGVSPTLRKIEFH